MCEFCHHDPEYSNDENKFFNEVAKAPIMINDIKAANLILSGNWSNETDGPVLNAELFGYECDPLLAAIALPINYCPICGKKLIENSVDVSLGECARCMHDPEVSDNETEFLSELDYTDIKMNGMTVGRIFVSMENRAEKGAYLDVELFGMPSGQPQIADIEYPIHYCPFCGKKLD